MAEEYDQWSTLAPLLGSLPGNWPEDDQVRLAAYEKYDQMYWNDPTQYAIRVLEGEQPLYIPNARVIVNTTSYYLTKGLKVQLGEGKTDSMQKLLDDFLKRETFLSTYNLLKQTAVCRGDGVLHVLANPNKAEGTRISLEMVHPGNVYRVWDDGDHTIRADIAYLWVDPEEEEETTGQDPEKIRVLRYTREENEDSSDIEPQGTIYREELLYQKGDTWWELETEPLEVLLEKEVLDPRINQIPLYWFKNIDWGDTFGSSELRGLETLQLSVSQGATDTQASLGLEGLGVYATDGGRPVNEAGQEEEWEVSPGKVMEVPQGSYFRRVEGVGSITPMMDQIEYLEEKANQASGISDVAIGRVDAVTAESGIALAIKFSPTLAKLEFRDQQFGNTLVQLFYDLKAWFKVYEDEDFGDVEILVTWDADKLPVDRKARLNELNNMLDRKVISRKFYREEAVKLGYEFPSEEDMAQQIEEDILLDAIGSVIGNILSAMSSNNPEDNPNDPEEEDDLPPESNPDNGSRETKKENQSNNISRVNESNGTEA